MTPGLIIDAIAQRLPAVEYKLQCVFFYKDQFSVVSVEDRNDVADKRQLSWIFQNNVVENSESAEAAIGEYMAYIRRVRRQT